MSAPPKNVQRFSFVLEKIACGKGTCGTCGGTKLAHGPYWYGYFTRPNGRAGKVYVGKDLDDWKAQHLSAQPQPAAPKTAAPKAKAKAKPAPAPAPKAPKKEEHPEKPVWEKMISKAASPAIAARILGVQRGVTQKELTKTFRALILKHHPDKGGDSLHAMAINAAFAMLKPLTK